MAQQTEIVLICDLCESESLVETRSLTLDGHAVELEACDPCWTPIVETLAPVYVVGRKGAKSKSKRR